MNDWNGLLAAIPAGLGFAGLLIWGLAALLLTVLVAAWIVRDAATRGLDAPWAWAMGAAFQPLVVLAVYVFTRDSLSRSTRLATPTPPGAPAAPRAP
ncbi:MAG TPA: hypothetical protein VFY71_01485 [Planctomycetota bacterium]|nr:hypothetical protein [Planctomycetota bacterium]